MKLTTDNLTFLVHPMHAYPAVIPRMGLAYIPTGVYFTPKPKDVSVMLEDEDNLQFERIEYTEEGELVIVVKNKLTRSSVNLRNYPVIAEVILQDPPNGS